MIRFVTSLIIIVLSVFAFVGLVLPKYQTIKETQAQEADLARIVDNANQLAIARQELEQKYASISQSDKERLRLMVPDDIKNVQLILELQELADLYGITVKDVGVNSDNNLEDQDDFFNTQSPYEEVELQFTLVGEYRSFVRFIENIEQSLRLIDVTAIDFSVPTIGEEEQGEGQTDTIYTYNIILSTYWTK